MENTVSANRSCEFQLAFRRELRPASALDRWQEVIGRRSLGRGRRTGLAKNIPL